MLKFVWGTVFLAYRGFNPDRNEIFSTLLSRPAVTCVFVNCIGLLIFFGVETRTFAMRQLVMSHYSFLTDGPFEQWSYRYSKGPSVKSPFEASCFSW